MGNVFNFHGNVNMNVYCKKCTITEEPDNSCGLEINSVTVDFEIGFIFELTNTSGTHVGAVITTNDVPVDMGCQETTSQYIISLDSANTLFSGLTIVFTSYSDDCQTSTCEIIIPISFSQLEIPVTGENTIFELNGEPVCTEDSSYSVVLAGPNSIVMNNTNGNLTIPAQEIDSNGPGGVYIYYYLCGGEVVYFVIVFMANPQGPQQMYSCDGATCIEDENGQYDHSSCYGNCQGPTTMYSCSGQQCIEDENGIYEFNNCNNQCCLPFNELISYDCVPFEFLGEITEQTELIYSDANLIFADGACGTTEVYSSAYQDCCMPTGTYLAYSCNLGTKTEYYTNVECGGGIWDVYTIVTEEHPDCLGVSALLFTLEYDDILDAPVSGSNVSDWQTYFRIYNNSTALLTNVIINGNFVEIYGYNVTFQSFNHGIFSVTDCSPLKGIIFTSEFTNPQSVSICNDYVNTIEEINLSTFSELTSLTLIATDISTLDLSIASELLSLTIWHIGANISFTELDLSNNLNLQYLALRDMRVLLSLDITNNIDLLGLELYSEHSLTEIDLSNNINLGTIDIADCTGITNIDISNNVLLNTLKLQSLGITTIDLSTFNPNYGTLALYNLALTNIDLAFTNNITNLTISDTLVSSLTIGNMTQLIYLSVTQNDNLFTLDISNNTLLTNVVLINSNFDQTTIDSVLANLVANNLNNGYLLLQGGTNAAPGIQGALDAATLISRGWSVTTN